MRRPILTSLLASLTLGGHALAQTTSETLLSPEERIIARAAELRQTTLSKFMLENAYQAAQQVLADQVHFTVPSARWKAFCHALDAPPRDIPALRRFGLRR